MKRILWATTACFVLTLAASGQRVKPTIPRAVPTPTPTLTEIEAVTKDGKSFLLRSDGTWKPNPALPAVVPPTFTVNLQAALVFKSGDVVPLARTPFYLLSDNIEPLISTDEMRQVMIEDIRANSKTDDYYQFFSKEAREKRVPWLLLNVFGTEMNLSEHYALQVRTVLARLSKFAATTDFQGNGSFKGVPSGKYFLFGCVEMRKNFACWNLPIDVSADQSLILDTNNTLQ